MNVTPTIITERLLIDPLSIIDQSFVFELLNTDGWKKFIGDRHIHNLEDAAAYIERILANETISYWVVRRKDDHKKIGVVTFIKRDYLPNHDIGFAFLPQYCKNAYAFEATTAILKKLITEKKLTHILATTLPDNVSSISLLKKIGLQFEKEITADNLMLHLYGSPTSSIKL